MIKVSFYNLLHVYLHIIPKRQFKGKREKNKECKYFAEAHPVKTVTAACIATMSCQ